MSRAFCVLDWILMYWVLTGSTGTCLPSSVLYYETLTYDLNEVTRLARKADIHSTNPLTMLFTAFNRTFPVDLFPSRAVFDPNVEFVFGDSHIDYDTSTFYHGTLRGEPHSTVKGHVVNGLFDGFIKTHEHTYHIEKADKYFKYQQEFHSVIYRSADVQIPDTAVCGASGAVLDKLQAMQATARPTKEDYIVYGKRNKRQVTVSGAKFCPMLIAADHLYLSNVGGGDMSAAISELVAVMSEVQTIFQQTDFDNDGTADGIVPLIARVQILDQSDPGYRFSSTNINVNDYLDIWSQVNHEQFCLALLLTYRDFDNGVLGLAWVAQAPGGNRGGICEDGINLNVGTRYLNTAIVTLLNYNQRQPRPVTVITVAHELGHNFGSPHDPTTQECAPDNSDGNFIMFPRATDGRLQNNNQFSPCSGRSILPVLQSKSDCFSTSGTFCGNGVIEDGEQCDCGLDCANDPCCDSMCMLTTGSVCSPSQACCKPNCEYQDSTVVCQAATECGEQVLCTGTNATCAQPTPKGSLLCNNDQNVCVMGVCSGSICVRDGYPDCQCTSEGQKCHVCCQVDGTCQSSFDLESILGVQGQNRESGRSCDNFAGYCDTQNPPVCRIVDNEGTLNDLLDIFTIETLNDVVAWLTVYWYIPVAVVIGLIILIILLQLTYRRRKPIKRRFSQARRSLRRNGGVAEAQTGGVGGVTPQDGGRRRRQEAPRQISPREAINRLSHFFPNADRSVIQNVIQSTRTESKAVKKLLDRGYPMKRIPIPRA